jgi:hypothetical protein
MIITNNDADILDIENNIINDYYNENEINIKIHTYKQFIKKDDCIKEIKENKKIIKTKIIKRDFKLDYKNLIKKYNIEIKNSINEINRKHASTINEIKCKDILI